MAYADVVSLSQTIHQILNNNENPISNSMRHQLTSLREDVVSVQNFLDDFPKKAVSLEPRIRDAANDVEDHLEHYMYDRIRIRSKPFADHPLFYFVFDPWNVTQLAWDILRRIMAWEILNGIMPYSTTSNNNCDFDRLNASMEEISSISREVKHLRSLRSTETADTPTPATSSPMLASVVDGATVGLDDDLLKMKNLLCGGSSTLQAISIVGMGGIGKTTLATTIYHDELIVERFPIRAWVTVSQDYKAENIFLRLLDFFKQGGDESGTSSETSPAVRVFQFLYKRRYLIVLDDIWSTEAWDDVKMAFPDDDENGSRVVLTTRITDVASYVTDSSNHHQMKFMGLDQSWNLLEQKVFPGNRGCPSTELECIGKDIARSCGGLPLAITLAAGILSTIDETPLSWSKVADTVRSAEHLENIISLSYTHLPLHLRPCFLYMGCFPEDYEIRVSKLTKLWIAEGFVNGESPEQVAKKYLNDLVNRSLALVTKRKSDGTMKSCNVHDMVRDTCKRRALEENYQRRLSIAHPNLLLVSRSTTIRSLVCVGSSLGASFEGLALSGLLGQFRLLRVLDLPGIPEMERFPNQVFSLYHLRYLAFPFFPSQKSGSLVGISILQNLRTLIFYKPKLGLSSKNSRVGIPVDVFMLPHLTHFVSHYPIQFYLRGPPLEELATLSMATISICTRKLIGTIPNVKKMGIIYFGEEDHQFHNLLLLRQLEKLKLVCSDNSIIPPTVMVNRIFPDTLKKLTLSGWRFPWKYMEKVGCLPNLQVLKLRDFAFQGDTWETMEEQFPSLEHLYIDGSDLKDWVTEESHFPSLKRLFLFRCDALRQIPDEIGEIPTLELIEVDQANKFLVECVKQIQKQQHDIGNYDLQVRCISHQVQKEIGMFQLLTRTLKEVFRHRPATG